MAVEDCLDNFYFPADDRALRECLIREGERLVRTGREWMEYCERMQDIIEPGLIQWWQEMAENMINYGSYLVNYNKAMVLLEDAKTNPHSYDLDRWNPYPVGGFV